MAIGKALGFRMIMDMGKGQAMAVAMNILGNREDAEDACQETFIQVFRGLDHFDRQKSFRDWLLTILYRRCPDRARKKKRFRLFFSRFKKEVTSSLPTPNLPSSGDKSLSRHILSPLSPKERAAITVWANEGYTAEEISPILGYQPSAARVYLSFYRLEENQGASGKVKCFVVECFVFS